MAMPDGKKAPDYSIDRIMKLAEPYRRDLFPLLLDKRMDKTQRALVLLFLINTLSNMETINATFPEDKNNGQNNAK
jgi:hypothetical protein